MLNIPYEVQQALRKGDMRKNYKMKVNDVDPDTGERTYLYTIDNDSLVSESVKVDERMVTGKVLKFGLCEGSSLEFQYFDHPNINGKDVQVYCSVEYVDGNGDVDWYDIPMGWYTVDQCPMQWETGIYKVTAYNKLKSDYLDAKANSLIEDMQSDSSDTNVISLITIQNVLLQGYEIYPKETAIIAGGNGTTGGNYYSNISIKLNGSSTTYHLMITSQYLYFRQLDTTKRYKITFDEYLSKLQSCISSIKAAFNDEVQNPDVAWQDYLNSNAYQIDSSVNVIFGSGNVINGFYCLSDEEPTSIESSAIICHGVLEKLEYLYGVGQIGFRFPIKIDVRTSDTAIGTVIWQTDERITLDDMFVGELPMDNIDSIELSKTDLADVTLRDIVSANYELHCQYGKLDRETDLFAGVELNQGGLYPADTLYPDNALYPSGNMEHPFPSTYSKLWTDTVGEQSFRYLIITYKAMENGQEVEKTLQRTVNADGTTNYNMSDNWLFRNLVWSDADVGDYADAMVLKMKDIRWFPFEMWCAGLPYVETGDAIEITDKQGNTHTSYVLTRTLDGIHNLQDTFINGELDIF